MNDRDRDPHPDSPPADARSDLERAVDSRNDDVERGEGGTSDSPLAPTDVFDGNSGTGGVVKNRDDTAQ